MFFGAWWNDYGSLAARQHYANFLERKLAPMLVFKIVIQTKGSETLMTLKVLRHF
jgi:hypothetical protein